MLDPTIFQICSEGDKERDENVDNHRDPQCSGQFVIQSHFSINARF